MIVWKAGAGLLTAVFFGLFDRKFSILHRNATFAYRYMVEKMYVRAPSADARRNLHLLEDMHALTQSEASFQIPPGKRSSD